MIVFAGPSLAGCAPERLRGFDIRPPAEQGDVYLATRDAPEAIGIIDGYFEGAPSVWHKEILWALTQGIAVFGAASMGALRAAELDGFGMCGVGQIYANYRSGTFEDDDEVALLHGPSELGYPALSLAMVNARATLDLAVKETVVTRDESRALTTVAKALFYKNRTWASVVAGAGPDVIAPHRGRDLLQWLDANTRDQKQLDALDLLDVMRSGGFAAPDPAWHFEQTDLWVNATTLWKARRPADDQDDQDDAPTYRIFGDSTVIGD